MSYEVVIILGPPAAFPTNFSNEVGVPLILLGEGGGGGIDRTSLGIFLPMSLNHQVYP